VDVWGVEDDLSARPGADEGVDIVDDFTDWKDDFFQDAFEIKQV
jgi:hypothetical protein